VGYSYLPYSFYMSSTLTFVSDETPLHKSPENGVAIFDCIWGLRDSHVTCMDGNVKMGLVYSFH
jgi:hypothetical protein